jgi:sulfonate transport system substrate-binding protein
MNASTAPKRAFPWRWHRTALVFLLLGAASCKQKQTIRIGFQKYGALLVLKERGTLEKALAESSMAAQWFEFPSGPPMMEAFSAGKIDFGLAGEAPPVFAQASGVPIVYLASDPPAPAGEAILVRKGSLLRSVADLRGKKIAVNRGSNVHYFLAAALAASGVRYEDVSLVFLPPADARAAFESGNVDAWAIWDPYLSSALHTTDARVLHDAQGIASNVPYYLSTRSYASSHADVLRIVEREIRSVDAYIAANPHEVAALLAPKVGMPVEVIEDSLHRNPFDLGPLRPATIANQQRVAETFLSLGLISKGIRVDEAVVTIPN